MTETIGTCWLNTVSNILNQGETLQEYLEIRNVLLNFTHSNDDEIVEKFGNKVNIENMKKVFFTDITNEFNHSYKKLMRGPYCRNDFSDIIDVLTEKRLSNRALLNIDNTQLKQPCINSISFSIRNEILNVAYFSRGQDFYNKFYCDALCISEIGKYVQEKVQAMSFTVTAFIVSAHIYHDDIEKSKILIRDAL